MGMTASGKKALGCGFLHEGLMTPTYQQIPSGFRVWGLGILFNPPDLGLKVWGFGLMVNLASYSLCSNPMALCSVTS